MEIEQIPADVSGALARVRRRARYLADAEGSWSWGEFVPVVGFAALAVYLIVWREPEWSPGTLGPLFLVSAIAGWQHSRLKRRVDALTKLLAEIGSPGEV